MNRYFPITAAIFGLLLGRNSFAYEVWMGVSYPPSNAAVFPGVWSNAAADDAKERQAGTPAIQDAGLMTNFTLRAWVNPTAGRTGINGTSGPRHLVCPTDGTWFGLGANHGGGGISVGTSGLGVFENSASAVSTKLEYAAIITNCPQVTATCSNNVPRLYINGTLVKTGAASAGKIAHPGGWDSSGWGWFKGLLDEVRVYRRALTAAEIIQIIKAES